MMRASDSQIVERARAESRIILTFDLDFGDVLALVVHEEPSVIIFRLSDERADAVNQRLSAVLNERSNELENGALIVVEDTRYRVRNLPIKRG
jgi:predicted nuclease of predicted toxin-antitoxin system